MGDRDSMARLNVEDIFRRIAGGRPNFCALCFPVSAICMPESGHWGALPAARKYSARDRSSSPSIPVFVACTPGETTLWGDLVGPERKSMKLRQDDVRRDHEVLRIRRRDWTFDADQAKSVRWNSRVGGRAMRVNAAAGPTPQVRRRDVWGSALSRRLRSGWIHVLSHSVLLRDQYIEFVEATGPSRECGTAMGIVPGRDGEDPKYDARPGF